MSEEAKTKIERQARMPFDEIEWEEDGPPSPDDEKPASADPQPRRAPDEKGPVEPRKEEPEPPREEKPKVPLAEILRRKAGERLRILSADEPDLPPDLPIEEPHPGPSAPGPAESAPKAEPETSELMQGEETIGEILLAAREREGRSLEFMSEETKIPKLMLQYLETDNFEAIPAKVYVKGFLKTYAAALGLDVQHILSKYELLTGQTHKTKGDHWEVETEIVEEKLASPKWLRRLIVPAIGVVILIIVLIRIGVKREERPEPARQPDLREELLQKKAEPEPSPAPLKVENVQTAEAAPAAAESMELRLSTGPTDSSWVELNTISIVDQAPETTAYRFMLAPGRARTFEATEQFVVIKVGNAGGVVFELNGVKLPPMGRKGKVVTDHRITRDDLPKDKRKRS
jgi:cytoskeletal protein RodZ